MRKIKLPLFGIILKCILFSCMSDKKKSDFDKDHLKFEIHKFYISNSDIGCLNYDLEDYNKISIDSIKEFPKHIYLQEKIEFQKQAFESYIKDYDSIKEHNPNLFYKVLDLHVNELNSLKNIFSKTDKNEIYYKCYFSYQGLDYSKIIILNEKYKPIECISMIGLLELETE